MVGIKVVVVYIHPADVKIVLVYIPTVDGDGIKVTVVYVPSADVVGIKVVVVLMVGVVIVVGQVSDGVEVDPHLSSLHTILLWMHWHFLHPSSHCI